MTRRAAQTIFYSLASEEAAAVMRTLYAIYCGRAGGGRVARPASKMNGARQRGA